MPDDRAIIEPRSEPSKFNNPPPITEGPDGTVYVGESGADKITALEPPSGTWVSKQLMPEAVLDAGGKTLGTKHRR